jgi:hypothetical protein
MRAKYLTGLILSGACVLWTAPASSQDALRVRQLENEVSRLQRELDAQSRRIDQLERSVRGAATMPSVPAPDLGRRPVESSPAWLVSTNWDRVRPGMKDVDVIALLGRPTSVRQDPDGKSHALLYAMEIGPTAVLAGNVQLNESGVSQVNKPTLR